MLLQAVCAAVDLLGRVPACREVGADESSGGRVEKRAQRRTELWGDAGNGRPEGWTTRRPSSGTGTTRDAPGRPHGGVSAGYAATSSASASRSKRVPLKLP